MDILAARKKAAERAKAAKAGSAAPANPPEGKEPAAKTPVGPPCADVRPGEADAALPPAPTTTYIPGEQLNAPADPVPAERRDEAVPVAAEQPPSPKEPGAETTQDQETPREQEREMLAFLLGNEEYAVPVDKVQEVLTPREITPVPHTQAYLLGVCSLRGTVLPIIDMHRRLGLAEASWDEKSRIIVIGLGRDDRMGLFVDRVRGVIRYLPSTVRPVPETIEQGAEFLQGIIRKGDRLFILLDVEKTVEI